MKIFILPFGKVTILESNIAEITINEGILLDSSMVDTYRNLLKSQLQSPFSLLINKIHPYSYTFDAQIEMGRLHDAITYRAVVVYSKSGEMATQIVMDINKNKNWNIKIFKERQAALDWLHVNLNNNKTAM